LHTYSPFISHPVSLSSTDHTYPCTVPALLLLPLPVLIPSNPLSIDPFTGLPLLILPMPVLTPSPDYLYSSFCCPSINVHRSPTTPPSSARPYPFSCLSLLLIPMPVHTSSPVSVYYTFQGPSLTFHWSSSTPHFAASPYPFTCIPLLHLASSARPYPFTDLSLLLIPMSVHAPSPVSRSSSFLCPSIPLYQPLSTPPSNVCSDPLTVHTPSPPSTARPSP
jgi:hypothetical protein